MDHHVIALLNPDWQITETKSENLSIYLIYPWTILILGVILERIGGTFGTRSSCKTGQKDWRAPAERIKFSWYYTKNKCSIVTTNNFTWFKITKSSTKISRRQKIFSWLIEVGISKPVRTSRESDCKYLKLFRSQSNNRRTSVPNSQNRKTSVPIF